MHESQSVRGRGLYELILKHDHDLIRLVAGGVCVIGFIRHLHRGHMRES